jgi:hypothetical protein
MAQNLFVSVVLLRVKESSEDETVTIDHQSAGGVVSGAAPAGLIWSHRSSRSWKKKCRRRVVS